MHCEYQILLFTEVILRVRREPPFSMVAFDVRRASPSAFQCSFNFICLYNVPDATALEQGLDTSAAARSTVCQLLSPIPQEPGTMKPTTSV